MLKPDLAAADIAVQRGLWSAEDCDRQNQLIEKCGLPMQLPEDFEVERVLDLLLNDKKVKDGKVRFILPTAIGKVQIFDDVDNQHILNSVQNLKP